MEGINVLSIVIIGICYSFYQWIHEHRTRVGQTNRETQRRGATQREVPQREVPQRREPQREAQQRRVLQRETPTGPVVYFANDTNGSSDREYRFEYKKVGDGWRAYILRMPSLNGRDPSGVSTHRLNDNGVNYVCWDRPVTTLKGMQAISKKWADCIQNYISTGRFG